MNNRKITCLLVMLFSAVDMMAADFTFRLKNVLGFYRNEVVEIKVPENTNARQCQLTNEDGAVVPFECVGDSAIRFQAVLQKASTMGFTLSEGTPKQPEKLTYAAIKAPTNRADIAWENDLTAYRMYSSVLLASETNTGNGVDLWLKKKSSNIIDQMYNLSNYHNESEYGVDAFSVNGKRLGVGGVSHVVNGSLTVHKPHDLCEVLANDALKCAFRLTYKNVDVNGVKYTKTVTVESKAGSLLNKATVCYTPVTATQTPAAIQLAVALYQHTDMSSVNPQGESFEDERGLIGWAENKSEGSITSPNARLYQGAYMPGVDVNIKVIDNHLCLLTEYTPGTELTYYFGGGWSVFPEGAYTCDDDWFNALERFADEVDRPVALTSWTDVLPLKDDVRELLDLANMHWQSTHPTHGDHFWNRAVYHTGNMAAYEVTKDQSYLDYSLAWAERNKWYGQTGTDKSKWKYTYGESADYVLFGDNQICFQVYADLYNLLGGEDKIARAREVMEYQMSTAAKDYWWWVDGFYMVMPVMTKLYNITGNALYLEKLHEYWRWGSDLMWDDEEGLYYRDGNYVYPGHKTNSGGKDFWARGNGWIMAALPRVLSELPEDDKYRDEYIYTFRRLAEALRKCQCSDAQGRGYWCRSLLEEAYAPGYETSGTALNTYGLLWGVNNGLLDEQVYGETIEKAWKYLTEVALQKDGTVGYVQPIGSNAAPGTYITASQTADFGVGAFLLACSEMMRYAAGSQSDTPLRVAKVDLADANVIEIRLNQLPDETTVLDLSHYLLNGAPIDATEIRHDGNGGILITTDEPFDYGRYTLTVSGLKSIDGTEMASDYEGLILRTVPLYNNTQIKAVSAIGAQSGNPASNTIDNTLSTRWSQEGKAQWIQFDLEQSKSVFAIDLAWYQGNTRVNYFDIKSSADGKVWTSLLNNQTSSGLTTELERYRLDEKVEARYIRVICNGASTSTWNSLTEARVCVLDETFDELTIPSELMADYLLPSSTSGGSAITWLTKDPSVMTSNGIVTTTDEEQYVIMTAYVDGNKREFPITVLPRNIEANLQLRYDFETADVYTSGTVRKLADHSPYHRDATLKNSKCVIDGELNLTSNTASGFTSNGYVLLPSHLVDSLRSYTIMLTATPSDLSNQPRLYDLGSASSNSMFLRANTLSAGYKYNGNTTVTTNGGELKTGLEQQIAVTYDALTHTTRVYVNGNMVSEDTRITYEPHQLAAIGLDKRNYLGRTQWWDTTSKANNVDYVGKMDNFRIYSLCLTADEITELFENISTDVDAPSIMANQNTYYDLLGRRTTATSKGIKIVNGKKIR